MKMYWRWIFFSATTVFCLLFGVILGNRAVTALSEYQNPDRSRCFVIDPGHGGEDGGAVSVTGRPESQYNLEISLRLRDLLELLGYPTKLTRTEDVSIYTEGQTLAGKKASDLKARVRIVSQTENPVLLSIHQNHFPDARYSGPQVFYADTPGSESLAVWVQDAMVSALAPDCNRKAKKSGGIYLMEHIRCPGLLIECGFLSNSGEEARLRDPEYQKKLAAVIAVSVCGYDANT